GVVAVAAREEVALERLARDLAGLTPVPVGVRVGVPDDLVLVGRAVAVRIDAVAPVVGLGVDSRVRVVAIAGDSQVAVGHGAREQRVGLGAPPVDVGV